MEYISVITRTDEIKYLINNRFNEYCFEDNGIKIATDNREVLEKNLAEIVGSYCEKKIISNAIDETYCDYPKRDRISIYNEVISKENMLRIKHLRYLIYSSLNNYLKDNTMINIEGFVNFRLKDYKNRIKAIVDEVAEKYFLEKEYEDFIEMIKIYINTQQPLVDIIHINFTKNEFKLITDKGEDVTDDYTSDIKADCRIITFSQDDILLSALIGMAPRKIIVHNNEYYSNKSFLETLRKIFINKITFV